jgi:tape measure domain-containing protein
MSKEVQIIISAKDMASGVVGNITKSFEDAESKVNRVGDRFTNLSGRLTGIAIALATGGGAAIKMAADMEQTEVAFTTLLGSTEKALQLLSQLKEFAKETPFEFTDLTTASRRMMALGFSAEQVIPILNILGDTTSALGIGAEGLNRIIFSLGQMKAKGAASAEEMRELANAGIPAWQLLADKIGKTVPEAMALAEKKAIDSQTALSAILGGLATDPKFIGGMQKQMDTLGGMWSNFMDTFKFTLTDIGDQIAQTFDLKTKLSGAIQVLQQFTDLFKNLDPGIKSVIVNVALFVAAIGPLTWVIGNLTKGVSALIGVLRMLPLTSLLQVIPNITFAFSAWAGGAATLGEALGFITGPIGWIIAGGAALYGIYQLIKAQQDKTASSSIELGRSFIALYNAHQQSGKMIDQNSKAEQDYQNKLNQIAKAFPQVVTEYDKLGNARKIDLSLLQQLIDKEDELAKKRAEEANKSKLDAIDSQIKRWQGELKHAQAIAQSFLDQGIDDYSKQNAAYMLYSKDPIADARNKYLQELGKWEEAIRNSNANIQKLMNRRNELLGIKPKTTTTNGKPGTLITSSIKPIDENQFDMTKFIDKLRKDLTGAQAGMDIFGNEMQADAKKADILKTAIITLVENGIDPQNTALGNLVEQYKSATEAATRFAECEKNQKNAVDSWVEGHRKLRDMLGQTIPDWERLARDLEKAASQSGVIPTTAEELKKLAQEIRNVGYWADFNQMIAEMGNWSKHMVEIATATAQAMQQALSDFFFDAVTGKLKSLSDYVTEFLQAVLREIANVAAQMLTNKIMSSFGFHIPGFAAGGNYEPGPMIVGENGPELMIPSTSGTIIPNNKLGGATVQVNVINQTGQPLNAKSDQPKFDGKRWIVNVWLEAFADNTGGLRDAVKAR